ncbi:MAG: glycosyltransferase family 39 protein [Thermodesulfobacteriota bacterium]
MSHKIHPGNPEHGTSREAIWILILGVVIRLYACQYTEIVNQDGTLYIHQARAIYYGQWDKITPCGTGFLSNYPFLVSGFYGVFQDWIMATRGVSLVFGSLMLIPLYLLFRRFFNLRNSALGTLIFAVMPMFVGHSADSIRDPVYWFFMILGIYLFAVHPEKKYSLYILASSLSFLMAAWARVEAGLIILLTSGCILIMIPGKRGIKLILFLSPIVLVTGASFYAVFSYHLPSLGLNRFAEIFEKITGPFSQYQDLRVQLKAVAPQFENPALRFFLPEARNFVWLVALGSLANRALEAYFYPLILVFVLGFIGLGRRFREDWRIGYFSVLVAGGIVLLYFHTLHWWMIYNRFLAVIILPSAVFAGFGLERLMIIFQKHLRISETTAACLLCGLILIFTLPKNLQPREEDKQVFKKIGVQIAHLEGNHQEISVASSMDTIRWLSFYANLRFKGAPCPQPYNNFDQIAGKSYPEFIRNLKDRNVKYFLWDEKHWPKDRFDFFQPGYIARFKEIGKWYHRDTGKMILFRFHS